MWAACEVIKDTGRGRTKAGCTQFMNVMRPEWNIYILNGLVLIHLPSCFPSTTHQVVSSLTAEVYVNDSINPYCARPHSLFCHGSNTISVLAGILAEKKFAVHHTSRLSLSTCVTSGSVSWGTCWTQNWATITCEWILFSFEDSPSYSTVLLTFPKLQHVSEKQETHFLI